MPPRSAKSSQKATPRRRTSTKSNKGRRAKNTAVDPIVEDNAEIFTGLIVAGFGQQAVVRPYDSALPPLRCHIRSSVGTVVAGDQVRWCEGQDLGIVLEREPRETLLERADAYGNLKPVAANVSQMVITIAPEPEPHENLIDRYLVMAEVNALRPLILLNKNDLVTDDNREDLIRLLHQYEKLGYDTLRISAHSNENLSSLEEKLAAHTSIFVGQSGVGKSSLVKSLLPDITIRIGEISDATAKGKHTTTHSELFHFNNGGRFIDSPGIRQFGLWHLDKHEVERGFIDIAKAAEQCKFRNCAHEKEKGCAVIKAVEKGDISRARFKSYKRIIHSLDEVNIKTDER